MSESFAVVGTGYWGENHVRVFKELLSEGLIDDLKVCDLDEKKARKVGKAFSVKWTTDYREILNDPDVKAVSIVTLSSTHFEIAKEFLEHGKDILVEKPMTLNPNEAVELVKISEKNDCLIMVGHIFRYHAAIQELKKMIERGDLGKVFTFISVRYSIMPPRRDMGVIFALGIHELDTFCYLLNKDYPSKITATAQKNLQPYVEETANLTIEFEEGTQGYAIESWLMPAFGKKRELIVVGSDKTAFVDYLKPNEVKIVSSRLVSNNGSFYLEDEGAYTASIEYKEPLNEEIKHFVECVRKRAKPISDGMCGVRAVKMAEIALESIKKKMTMEVKDFV